MKRLNCPVIGVQVLHLIPRIREVNFLIEGFKLIFSRLSKNDISLDEEANREWSSLILGLELKSQESSREPISLAFKLDFSCIQNQIEYETLILGLLTASAIGVNNLCIYGNSNLIIEQANSEFS